MNVVVLGSGPAGLVAAEAAAALGHKVAILSQTNDPSPIGGAQYLHKPIPGINSKKPDYSIEMFKMGDASGYASKIYGDPERATSWDRYPEGSYPAWDMRATYSRLYRKWRPSVTAGTVRVETIPGLMERFGLIVSSVPKMTLCSRGHSFQSQPIYIVNRKNPLTEGMHYITYNGYPGNPWSRVSVFDGLMSYEYPSQPSELELCHKEAMALRKAVGNDCDCPEEFGILTVGRYGRWQAGVLVADVYEEVQNALQLMS